ncbi:MAG: hypothetical protein JM58_01265 [Peptococcaceae bacterium BICA1-8]|nr:MAG: hypothetical protein JM58_01265 [Peptococcaceae bacterium BICA1-8]
MNDQDMKIVVIGSINMDLVIMAPRLPSCGETILGTDFFTNPGGKGANQAVAAARLGANVEMIGCVGNDPFGQELIANLQNEKVGISNIKICNESPTGIAVITVDQEGQNTIVVSSGANKKVGINLLQQGEEAIKQADIVLIQLEIPLATVYEAIKLTKRYNKFVILNPAPALEIDTEILKLVDIITPNKTEGNILTNTALSLKKNEEEVIKRLLKMGVKNVVMTCGGEGVIYNDNDDIQRIPAYPVKVVDTTAAGDCFNAALAVAITEGNSLSQAVDYAQKVASFAVSHKGAQQSLPFRKQLL